VRFDEADEAMGLFRGRSSRKTFSSKNFGFEFVDRRRGLLVGSSWDAARFSENKLVLALVSVPIINPLKLRRSADDVDGEGFFSAI